LPLPLFAFLWGSLSVPRPSKAFWITVITYTEVIVVIKYIFQFQFWPWVASGKVDINPFYSPRILGILKSDNYAHFDLALLLILFFHRFMLKVCYFIFFYPVFCYIYFLLLESRSLGFIRNRNNCLYDKR
jgi:hypothetical protein